MHNENSHFQYFALDFNEGYSAFHGSDLFAQAHTVNMAIKKIVGMYAKKKATTISKEVSPFKVVWAVKLSQARQHSLFCSVLFCRSEQHQHSQGHAGGPLGGRRGGQGRRTAQQPPKLRGAGHCAAEHAQRQVRFHSRH